MKKSLLALMVAGLMVIGIGNQVKASDLTIGLTGTAYTQNYDNETINYNLAGTSIEYKNGNYGIKASIEAGGNYDYVSGLGSFTSNMVLFSIEARVYQKILKNTNLFFGAGYTYEKTENSISIYDIWEDGDFSENYTFDAHYLKFSIGAKHNLIDNKVNFELSLNVLINKDLENQTSVISGGIEIIL